MNMISTVPFYGEMDEAKNQAELVKKLTAVWEKKNSKAARAGGVSLMALSLAACGGSDDTPYSEADKTAAVTTALTDASGTKHATVDAAITSNDTAAIATALTDASGTKHATVDAAITSNDTAIADAVDTSADDAAAISLSYRNAAAELGVTGTSTMTDAELITAIKTANDTAVADAVDTSVDDAAAINAAVVALGIAGVNTLAQLNTAYDLLANPSTYTLTTGTNLFTGSASANTFDATTSNSLNNGDVLDGGDGADTINVALNGANVAVNSTSIETFDITNVTAASTLNMASASGVTSIASTSSTAALTLNNLQSIPTVTINTNSSVTTLNFADAALAGSSDGLTINLQGITDAAGADTGDIVVSRAAGATNNLEAITLNSTTVANSVETLSTGGVNVTTLNVTGDQDLTITDALDTDYTVVNAASFTGGLTATLSATATTFTGGAGADVMTMGGADDAMTMGGGNDIVSLTTAQAVATTSIAGGDGTDSIRFSDDATVVDADFTLMTSVETVTADADILLGVTLGALASSAGVSTVTLTDTGGNDTVTAGAGFTNNLTVNFDSDATNANSVTATAYTGVLTVNADSDELDTTASTITGGTGTSDVLNYAIDGTVAGDLSNVTNVESIVVSDGDAATDEANTVTLDNANATYTSATNYQTITVDASAIGASADTANIDASSEADGKVVMIGGDGINTITLSGSANFGDTVTAAGGNDIIAFATANLTATDSIDGGSGADKLQTTNDATVVDADFTLITNVEEISATATNGVNVTLGALADAAGIRTVTFADEAGTTDTATIGAGFTSALTVQLDDDANANTVTATNYVGAGLTVKVDTADATGASANVLTGSAGTDVLEVSITGANTVTAQASMTNFETVTIIDGTSGTNHAATFTLADENATYTNSSVYQTLTVDASAIGASGDTANIDAALEADAKVIMTGGEGVNNITLSTSSNFGDTVNAAGGADVIIANATNLTTLDTIDGGAGNDTIQFNADLSTALTDAAFTNVSNVEAVTGTATTIAMNMTLGAQAQEAGIRTVTLSDTVTNETITVGAGFTSDLTVNLDSDVTGVNTITATNYTQNLSVAADASELDTRASTLTGGTGTDTLTVTGTGAAAVTLNVSALTNFENITLVGDGDATAADTITIATADINTADGATLTIDGSAMGDDDISVDLTNDTNGINIVKGASGTDAITGSASDLGDTLEGNGGIDTFTFASANLTTLDTVSGGAGVDIITLSDAATGTAAITDADFTNVTSVETLNHGNNALTITLGAEASEAGLVTLTGGSGANITTIGAGFTNDLTIATVAGGTETVTATSYTGKLAISADIDEITSADTITGGTGVDTLTITLDGVTDTAIAAADVANITNIDTIAVGSNVAAGLVLSDNNVASGATGTITATAMTTAALTLDVSAEQDGVYNITLAGSGDHQITLGNGNDTYTSTSTAGEDVTATAGNNTISTGDGDDTIVGGTGADTMNGQAGADTFSFSSANLTSNDTISGGSGTDILSMSNDSVVVDSDFTNATSVETLTSNSVELVATLGAAAKAAGIVTVTLAGDAVGETDNITLGAGYTNDVTISLDSDDNVANTITATNYTGTLTVTSSDLNMNSANVAVLTGGAGTDVLTYTQSTDSTLQGGSITLFDTININGDDAAADTTTFTTVDALVASGATLTINATGLNQANNDGILTFDGSAETNGHFNISTAGAGTHTITLGNGNDTYTGSTGTGIQTITATAGTNSITTGTGADVITGGSGTDTIAGGTGADVFTWASATNALNDTVTDWTSADDQISLTLDYSGSSNAIDFNGVRTSAGVASSTAVEATLSGKIGEYAYDTSTSKLLVNITADSSISGADIQVGLNAATTAANTVAAGDVQYTVTGTAQVDTIVTGAGADSITGGAGADLITGGAGDDTLIGGAGADKYKFSDTNGKDTITFVRNEDLLDFSNVTAQGTIAEASITNDAGTSLGATTLTSNTTIYYIDTDATEMGSATATSISDFTSTTAIATWLNLDDGVVAGGTSGDTNYLVINDGSDTDAAYVIKHTDDGDSTVTIEAAELEIIAVINSTVAGAVDAADGVIA